MVQLLTTADEVDKLQDELATMKPLLEDAVQESIQTMEQISKDTVGFSTYSLTCDMGDTYLQDTCITVLS